MVGGGFGTRPRYWGGGGGLGPKSLCTKYGPIRFSQSSISFFSTMVTLVWGRGGARLFFERGGGVQGGWGVGSSVSPGGAGF